MIAAYWQIRQRARSQGWRTRLRVIQRWNGTPFLAACSVLPREGVVVDVGCGFGLLSGLLALDQPGRQVIGLDVDEAKLATARALVGDRVDFRSVDLDQGAPLPEADAVVIWDVLHHLERPEELVRRAAAALRPGGVLVIKENDTEPRLKFAVASAVEVVAVGLSVTASAPVRFRTRAQWVRLLEDVGLRVTRAQHLPAREGWFVPHSLFVAERPRE